MEKFPQHRPRRKFSGAERIIVECDLDKWPHCGQQLKNRKAWLMRKTVQMLTGPQFIAGKSKMCENPACSHPGETYYASRVWTIACRKAPMAGCAGLYWVAA